MCAHQSLPVARRVALLWATHPAGILVKSLLGGRVGLLIAVSLTIVQYVYCIYTGAYLPTYIYTRVYMYITYADGYVLR